ncbi:MAG: SPOR domain-containing protein [Cardiobacteriaceae bacterium]|nr:SPOR domain-containing protein [Cardiobacteriaceae bacterium]
MNNNNPFNRNPQNPQGNMQTNRPPQYGQQNQQYQQQAPFGQQNQQQAPNMFDRPPQTPTKLKFHPSPLQSKIVGFVVLAIAGFLMGRAWLKPEIPEELQNYGNPSPTVPVNNRVPEVKKPAPNPQEPIVLSSLQEMESDNGAPPPALENPNAQNSNSANQATITPNLRANNPTTTTAPVVIEPEAVEEEPQVTQTANKEEQRKKEEQARREREKKQAEAKKQQQKKKEEQARREREKKQAEARRKEADKKAAEKKQAEKKKAPPAPKLELTSNKSNNQTSNAKKSEKADKWIYVGVYAKKENVDRAVARLRKNNFPVKVATLKDGKTRVSVGPYRDSEVAGIRKKLNAIGGF